MSTGPMKFGATNNAGASTTELHSSATSQTLRVVNTGRIGAMVEAAGVGAFGVAPPAEGIGLWGVGQHGVIGGSDEGTGVDGWSHGIFGVRGLTSRDGRDVIAVMGAASGDASVGVCGEANVGNAFGVWGKATNGWAGYFNGKVAVNGYLVKAAGGFEIDHPLDPENRYLRHSFVESDEQLNVYSGTVVTDGHGAAVIELPEYFEALNQDFRYQLTVIGDFAQVVVTEEVRENRFAIATDRPEVKVSWQISGVRRDRYVRAHPFTAEEAKPEDEQGTYLHPEAWGKPESAGRDYAREAALREALGKLPEGGFPVKPV